MDLHPLVPYLGLAPNIMFPVPSPIFTNHPNTLKTLGVPMPLVFGELLAKDAGATASCD